MFVSPVMRGGIVVLLLSLSLTAPAADRPEIDSQIPDFTLPKPGEGELQFSDVYETNGAVLVVLRGWPGYQCPICTAQVSGYITERLQFKKRGVPVVFVYPGPSDNLQAHAAEFTERMDLPELFTFVLDPDFEFTNRYGLRWNKEGQTAYPATFIVDKTGRVLFRKISDSVSGRVPANRVLELIDRRLEGETEKD